MSGAIVWRGVSALDDVTPIVLVVTGLTEASHNAKTGDMVQTYILVAGWSAKDAIHNGTDFAICGDCKHRGVDGGQGRTCYVNLATGLGQVSRHLMQGRYPARDLRDVARAIAGRQLRCGTYGDPAAIPVEVWGALREHVAGWTGYTHQWRSAPAFKSFLMASVDSPAERDAAKAAGWRTFRVRGITSGGPEPLAAGSGRDGEITCPASAEGGHRVTCADCGLCSGNARPAKDIAIIDHSVQARALQKRQLRVLQTNQTHEANP